MTLAGLVVGGGRAAWLDPGEVRGRAACVTRRPGLRRWRSRRGVARGASGDGSTRTTPTTSSSSGRVSSRPAGRARAAPGARVPAPADRRPSASRPRGRPRPGAPGPGARSRGAREPVRQPVRTLTAVTSWRSGLFAGGAARARRRSAASMVAAGAIRPSGLLASAVGDRRRASWSTATSSTRTIIATWSLCWSPGRSGSACLLDGSRGGAGGWGMLGALASRARAGRPDHVDAARGIARFGWIDDRGHAGPRDGSTTRRSPGSTPIPRSRSIYGGYWDVYRLVVPDRRAVRGVPLPDLPEPVPRVVGRTAGRASRDAAGPAARRKGTRFLRRRDRARRRNGRLPGQGVHDRVWPVACDRLDAGRREPTRWPIPPRSDRVRRERRERRASWFLRRPWGCGDLVALLVWTAAVVWLLLGRRHAPRERSSTSTSPRSTIPTATSSPRSCGPAGSRAGVPGSTAGCRSTARARRAISTRSSTCSIPGWRPGRRSTSTRCSRSG